MGVFDIEAREVAALGPMDLVQVVNAAIRQEAVLAGLDLGSILTSERINDTD